MKNFALIGAAGYIAPRHMKAIKETGNNLIAALDPNDSVGIIDSYFPDADFFTEFERFDRHLEKQKRKGVNIDYVVICSPNYLHDSHIRFGLRLGADVICEKPLTLMPWNAEGLKEIEKETNQKVFNILQLRLHPSIIQLKEKVKNGNPEKVYNVDLTYLTSRGKWYYTSWKGEAQKSGGIATNIGIHFFDMLQWIFGEPLKNEVHIRTHDRAAGFLKLRQANVKWFLSINYETIPSEIKEKGMRTYRSISADGEEVEFSQGFTDLHTLSYQAILSGNGFGIDEAQNSIGIIHEIRTAEIQKNENNHHPFTQLPLAEHPFGLA